MAALASEVSDREVMLLACAGDGTSRLKALDYTSALVLDHQVAALASEVSDRDVMLLACARDYLRPE